MQITFREIGAENTRSHHAQDHQVVRIHTDVTHLELTVANGNIHILEPRTSRTIVFNGEQEPEWDAVTVKEVEYDPSDREGMERMLKVGIQGIVRDATTGHMSPSHRKELVDRLHTYVRHYQDRATVAATPDVLTFGQFWDAMAEHLSNGADIAVFRARGGAVYTAHRSVSEDGTEAIWNVIWNEYGHSGGGKQKGVPLHYVSRMSGFEILGTYRNETDAPF